MMVIPGLLGSRLHQASKELQAGKVTLGIWEFLVSQGHLADKVWLGKLGFQRNPLVPTIS